MFATFALLFAAAMFPATAPTTVLPAPVAAHADTAFAPAGKYELYIDIQGNQLGLGMELWQEDGAWKGTITSQQMGATNLSTVSFDNEKRLIKIELPAPGGDGSVYGEMELKTDNSVAGALYIMGQGIPVGGKKIVP